MDDSRSIRSSIWHEVVRKALHALGCVWAVWGLYWPALPIAGLSFFSLIYLAYEAARLRGHGIGLIERLGHLTRRPGEESRPALGPVCLAAGVIICFAAFDPRVACAAILAACGCDCAAGVGGRLWGRHKIPFSSGKTIQGSLVGWVFGFATCAPVAGGIAGVVGSLAAAIAELLPLGDMDNIVVPVAAACALAFTSL